jgi:hypothetical protein
MTPGVVAHLKHAAIRPVALYAARFARRCLLEHLCPPDHPVLNVEHQLLAEARKRLHEHLLQNQWDRKDVERRIRDQASEKAAFLIEDSAIRDVVIAKIRIASLDEAFPVID